MATNFLNLSPTAEIATSDEINLLTGEFHLLDLDTYDESNPDSATTYLLDKRIEEDGRIFIVSSKLMDEQHMTIKQMPVFAINHKANDWKLGKYIDGGLVTSEETFKGGASITDFNFNGIRWQIDGFGATPLALMSQIPTIADDVGAVPTERTINNKSLLQDINLTASDVDAIPANKESAFEPSHKLTYLWFEDGTLSSYNWSGELNRQKMIDVGLLNKSGYSWNWTKTIVKAEIGTDVTGIEEWAFANCTGLTSVTIPDSVTSIGDYVFDTCTSLTSISLPSATTIGAYAFYSCAAVTTVLLPVATSIGRAAFSDCTSLTSISLPAVTSIGEQSFYGCNSLTSVYLPAATSIGISAFQGCTSLSSILLPAATNIGDAALHGCTSLASVSFPAATSIGSAAFEGCTTLSSVSFPSATEIGSSAFKDCDSLTHVSLPVAISIGGAAFYGCNALASVSLPAATGIGNNTFYSCTSLDSVSLISATEIGPRAFYSCFWLMSVDFGSAIRSSIPALNTNAFPEQSGHTCRIIVPDANYTAWTTASGWSDLTSMGYEFVRHSEIEDWGPYVKLNGRGPNHDGFSEWTILRDGVDVTAQVQQPYFQDSEPQEWIVIDSHISTDYTEIGDVQEPEDAVSLSWTALDDDDNSIPYTATREALPGYVLGPYDGINANKVLPKDTEVVHKTGDETVSGVKTFNDNILAKSSVQIDNDVTATKHGLVGKDVDFSTGGNENFAVGHDHKFFGKESFAVHDGNRVGAKGWYFKAIDTTNIGDVTAPEVKIYLTRTQPVADPRCRPINISTGSGYRSANPEYDIPYIGPKANSVFNGTDPDLVNLFDENGEEGIGLNGSQLTGKLITVVNILHEQFQRSFEVKSVDATGSIITAKPVKQIDSNWLHRLHRKSVSASSSISNHDNEYVVFFPELDQSTVTGSNWVTSTSFGCSALGDGNVVMGYNSFAAGIGNRAEGNQSIALGFKNQAIGMVSVALGSQAIVDDHHAFVWNPSSIINGEYHSHGDWTFNINPDGGINGFYIKDKTFKDAIVAKGGTQELFMKAVNGTATQAELCTMMAAVYKALGFTES